MLSVIFLLDYRRRMMSIQNNIFWISVRIILAEREKELKEDRKREDFRQYFQDGLGSHEQLISSSWRKTEKCDSSWPSTPFGREIDDDSFKGSWN